jgi:hypothetical protein
MMPKNDQRLLWWGDIAAAVGIGDHHSAAPTPLRSAVNATAWDVSRPIESIRRAVSLEPLSAAKTFPQFNAQQAKITVEIARFSI